jgi:hypothetical protein
MVVGTGDSRSANVASIGPKASKFYGCSGFNILKGAFAEAVSNRLEESLAGFRVRSAEIHGSAQDDQAGVDHVNHAGDSDSKVSSRLFDKTQTPSVSLLGRFVNLFCGDFFDV